MQDAATSYPGQQCGAFVAGLETLLYSRTLQCGSFCAPWHGQLAGVQTSPATVVLGATCSSTGLAYARTACTPSSERTLLPAPPPAPARIDSNRRRWSTVRRGTNEGRGSKEAGKVPRPAAQSRATMTRPRRANRVLLTVCAPTIHRRVRRVWAGARRTRWRAPRMGSTCR